ncbi:glycoside hydrolase family 43 protein [Hymenobacter weizhouensis]|uniref:glycoside hydrolase family 43 protein n=1 Tax=Hymenobacter sp. YIM 151500-1 TaxID=2987689 RepID=UPI002227F33A|nr:glycoside hydrolase family 43 protein [Hymenobacter sp. YIM 151500-1]UYZ62396.1 glycoside hydrolase family 43 protein [Hymenobacter sp. YIM 151500-1]
MKTFLAFNQRRGRVANQAGQPASHPFTLRALRLLVSAVGAASLLAACENPAVEAPQPTSAPGTQLATTTFYNPLRSVFSPDPDMEYYNGNYYLTFTNDANLGSIVIRKAASITGLANAADVTVWTDNTPARTTNMWSPSLFRYNSRWYIYYTATNTSGNNHRMYVLESSGDDPMGPYSFKAELRPPNKADVSNIDGVAFERGGKLYLVSSVESSLWIMPLSNPWTVSGNAVQLSYGRSAGTTWDSYYNEAPAVIQRNGKTYIAFSGQPAHSASYAIGLLTNTDGNLLNAGSWSKSTSPVLQRNDAAGVYGPGSGDFFKSPDGTQDWIVYHGKTNSGETLNTRTARAQPLTWNGDTPVFPVPAALSTPIALPAGDPGDNNLLANPDFEANATTPTSWNTWPGSRGTDADADYVEAGGYTGKNRLTHYKASAYQVYTDQSVSVANGTYTVKAWVISGGGQQDAFLSVKNYGGSELKASIKDVAAGWPNWRELTISGVNVTNGTITVGVYSNASAGNWLSVDNVRLYRQ